MWSGPLGSHESVAHKGTGPSCSSRGPPLVARKSEGLQNHAPRHNLRRAPSCEIGFWILVLKLGRHWPHKCRSGPRGAPGWSDAAAIHKRRDLSEDCASPWRTTTRAHPAASASPRPCGAIETHRADRTDNLSAGGHRTAIPTAEPEEKSATTAATVDEAATPYAQHSSASLHHDATGVRPIRKTTGSDWRYAVSIAGLIFANSVPPVGAGGLPDRPDAGCVMMKLEPQDSRVLARHISDQAGGSAHRTVRRSIGCRSLPARSIICRSARWVSIARMASDLRSAGRIGALSFSRATAVF